MTGEDVAKIAAVLLAVLMVAVLGAGFVLVVRDRVVWVAVVGCGWE